MVGVCVCVCVCERKTEREIKGGRMYVSESVYVKFCEPDMGQWLAQGRNWLNGKKQSLGSEKSGLK